MVLLNTSMKVSGIKIQSKIMIIFCIKTILPISYYFCLLLLQKVDKSKVKVVTKNRGGGNFFSTLYNQIRKYTFHCLFIIRFFTKSL